MLDAPAFQEGFDIVVCGAGAAGCVVAGRLAADLHLKVLLLEAGGEGDVEEVRNPRIWMRNIASERDWDFRSEPCTGLNGRRAPLPMGRVMGGGSAINGLVWARGHKSDFDLWAAESGDAGWSYESAVAIYKRIEEWDGPASPLRGTNGPMRITLPENPIPVVHGLLDAAEEQGIPKVADHNAEALAGDGCAAIANVNIARDGSRITTASAYVAPRRHQPNLTVVTGARVRRVSIENGRATAVEFDRGGAVHTVRARHEVVLSLGAINTAKVLMQSGIGNAAHLKQFGIPLARHLPGVGQNLQDHILVAGCVFEYRTPEPPRNNSAEFTFFCKSDPSLPAPDLQPMLEECAFGSEITRPAYNLPVDPAHAFTLAPGLLRPKSRGQVLLTGAGPDDALRIEANFLSAEEDVTALIRCIEICRAMGHSEALKPFVKRELMPGPLDPAEMVTFLRNAAGTYFHATCTAKMGRDEMAVVDGSLKVHGIAGLRVADGSIMPAIAGGNTLAPCVLIGERAADLIARDLSSSSSLKAPECDGACA
ncbi:MULTISPECIES: GMC family oxidoreductase [unclassified Xanthobacter]|uniref:GMC family oxidoreductase n=1 Tax=unclassified Xanthobacter TaxID=2623496 RepID=UPI001F28262C|nr:MULTISPECIES: GMC family oxidoreductase N-terminal domain-containing protein [unclassified Xanthobacter]